MTRATERMLEIWGGVECTVNRVGDGYFDQLECSGHATRDSDLDLLAELGIRTVRYPLLWERIAPGGVERACWDWADRRMAALRARGMKPIVGLMHHGSGPNYTSLIDPDFPEHLARYAGAVARRYPWIEQYTPINEPLTTARFSTLYGHWYPHARDDRLFARAVVNQLRATQLAMRAIREVNPSATLVQTEDLGKTYSTATLEYQATFENERRWLTFDALLGVLDRHSAMWHYLRWAEIAESELERLGEEACAPEILGINHYVTSERFLDERLQRYPPATHGRNMRHTYADVEAVRVLDEGIGGPRRVLTEAWNRYRRPIALTEIHLGATREEQIRWLHEAWCVAQDVRANSADIRALTTWSLFGAFDWSALLTRAEGHYEPGAFDVRSPAPRPTALATMVRSLARRGTFDHPLLQTPGWWRRPERLLYPPVPIAPGYGQSADVGRFHDNNARPILVAGATGTLGQAFARICEQRGIAYRLCSRREMNIADAASVQTILEESNAWAIVNAAGYVRVDDAEFERDSCFRENRDGAAVLAKMCARHGLSFLTFSSNLVFDGRHSRPYVEGDHPRPLNVYGHSKAAAERAVLEALPSALIVRTSAFFGPWDEHNFVAHAVRAIGADIPFSAACDEVVSPTFVPDLVDASLDLLIDGERGIWHLANDGAITWADFARAAVERAGLDASLVTPCPGQELGLPARRPRFSALASERGKIMPRLDDAITRYFAARPSCMQAA